MTTATGRRSGGGGGGGGPAPFLMKTHEMVEEEMSDDVISWSEKGTSFVVWKPVEFARDILPANFKHNNFSSFVRQLNTYGFRKVVPDRWEFANEYFRPGDCSLLSKIHRRKSAASPAKKPTNPLSSTSYNSGEAPSSSSTSSLPPPPPPPRPPSADMLELSNENKKLKKHNQILSSELAQAKLHCQELLAFLSNHAGDGELDAGLLLKEAAMHGVKITGEKEKEIEQKGEKECLKLFGVCLEVFGGRKKRGRCEESGSSGCGGRRHMASATGGVFC